MTEGSSGLRMLKQLELGTSNTIELHTRTAKATNLVRRVMANGDIIIFKALETHTCIHGQFPIVARCLCINPEYLV